MNFVLVVCLALTCGLAHAGVLPETHRGELIRMVLDNFWGKAKLPGGQFVQPASEQERITVPISRAAAHRTIDAGEISGLGEWCKLDWEPHYYSLTRAARARGFSDKQVAFVSVLHGAAQGVVATAMAKGGECNEDRTRIEQLLKQSTDKDFDGN